MLTRAALRKRIEAQSMHALSHAEVVNDCSQAHLEKSNDLERERNY